MSAKGPLLYAYDSRHPDLVANLLDRLGANASDVLLAWNDVWLDGEFKVLDEALRIEIDFLFTFELTESPPASGRVNFQDSASGLKSAREISRYPEDALRLWREVALRLQHPLLKSQVLDLLLTSRSEPGQTSASRTIEAYMLSADSKNVSAMRAALSLARANEVSRQRSLQAEEEIVRRAALGKIGIFVRDSSNWGAALVLLQFTSKPPRYGADDVMPASRMREWLYTIGQVGTYIDEVAAILLRTAENKEDRISSQRWHVDSYLSFAENEQHGMSSMHHAQRAAQLSESYGLRDLRDKAVGLMQSIDELSMDWQKVASGITISRNVARLHMLKYQRARNWKHAIDVFLASDSPSGSHRKNRASAEANSLGSVRRLISRMTFGRHGLPIRSDQDFLEEEVARTEMIAIRISSSLLESELAYIKSRFSAPGVSDVQEYMTVRYSSAKDLSRYFALALVMHWEGRYSDSARLAIPLIERAMRTLLLLLDEPMYRIESGNSPGRFPAMDFYIGALERNGLDEDWVRAYQVALLSQGMNMRNYEAHGFVLDFSSEDSALLLRLAGLLCAMPLVGELPNLERPQECARVNLRPRLGIVWR